MIINSKADESKVNEEQQERIKQLRYDFRMLFAMIEDSYCKPSRETSIGITKLEEALMWLIKGISREETKLSKSVKDILKDSDK